VIIRFTSRWNRSLAISAPALLFQCLSNSLVTNQAGHSGASHRFFFSNIIAEKCTISAHLLQCYANTIFFITEKKFQLGRVLALSS
jgi:hypothetical protein